jgi:hypothetical protein
MELKSCFLITPELIEKEKADGKDKREYFDCTGDAGRCFCSNRSGRRH